MESYISNLAQVSLPLVLVDDDKVIGVNDAFTELTGYSKDTFLQSSISDVFRVLGANIDEKIISALRNPKCSIFTKSYEPKFINVSIYQEQASDKRRTYIFSENPGSRLKDESLLIEQQKEQMSAVLSNMSDALFTIDINHNIDLLNDAARKYFYQPENIKVFEDISKHTKYYDMLGNEVPMDNLPGLRVIRGEKVTGIRLLMKRPDKDMYVEVSGSPICDSNGTPYMAILCGRDVTERVKQEQLIERQRDYLYNIIDNLDLPIIRLSYPDLKIIELNKKAYEYSYKLGNNGDCDLENKVTRKNIYDIYPIFKGKENFNLFQKVGKTKTTKCFNNLEITHSGKKVNVNLICHPLVNIQGEILEILMILVDITHEVEEKIAIQKMLKAQEQFFSFISHEFKTPLSVISSAVQAMKHICGSELSDTGSRFLDQIERSTLQQVRLVNNLLDIMRSDAGYLKLHKRNEDIVLLTKKIIDSVSIYAETKGLTIEFNSDLAEKIIAIDDEKYERILLNLLSNAIKFTPAERRIYVNIYLRCDKVYIEVKDEGIGIPKSMLKVIFERFKQLENGLTRSTEGSGIGLCLVKLLVKTLNGRITVFSEEGKGSSFTVAFPDVRIISDSKERVIQEAHDDQMKQTVNVEFSSV